MSLFVQKKFNRAVKFMSLIASLPYCILLFICYIYIHAIKMSYFNEMTFCRQEIRLYLIYVFENIHAIPIRLSPYRFKFRQWPRIIAYLITHCSRYIVNLKFRTYDTSTNSRVVYADQRVPISRDRIWHLSTKYPQVPTTIFSAFVSQPQCVSEGRQLQRS